MSKAQKMIQIAAELNRLSFEHAYQRMTAAEAANQQLAAALRAVVEHHDTFIDAMLGEQRPDLDPPAIIQARRVLQSLDGVIE